MALHEASALIVILNGMWVGGTGVQRLNTLLELAKDVVSDTVEAFRDLLAFKQALLWVLLINPGREEMLCRRYRR